MIKCYVIDDEFHAVETLSDLITSIPGLTLVGHATNPLVGLEYITSSSPPDLTFIDINMPELSGIELAALINPFTTVIFTTAYEKFAVEAFEKDALDYLLKPISRERFLKCITKFKKQQVKNNSHPEHDYFYIKGDTKGKVIRINIGEITYIEGALNYIIIHTTDGKHNITYLTMGEIQAYLPEHNFSRIHRSFIINNHKIKSITDSDVVLINNMTLTIGPVYKEPFFTRVNSTVIKTKRIH